MTPHFTSSPVIKLDCVDLVFCGTALMFVLLIKLSQRQIPSAVT